MKFAFWGSPKFARVVLERLIDSGTIPEILVCNLDRPVGRKEIITSPPTKKLILERGLKTKILQPATKKEIVEMKNSGLFNNLNFSILAAYSHIIPGEVIKSFPLGFLGVHPSLLPKYRGASPIQSALLNGEKETGSTIFLMDEQMDHGPILIQRNLDISQNGYDYLSLEEKLAGLSADLLLEVLPLFVSGKAEFREQDEKAATLTKKFSTEDGLVDLDKEEPEIILRKIKAFNPNPGAYAIIGGRRTKILEGKLDEKGNLLITRIVPEGKKEQSARITVESRDKR